MYEQFHNLWVEKVFHYMKPRSHKERMWLDLITLKKVCTAKQKQANNVKKNQKDPTTEDKINFIHMTKY